MYAVYQIRVSHGNSKIYFIRQLFFCLCSYSLSSFSPKVNREKESVCVCVSLMHVRVFCSGWCNFVERKVSSNVSNKSNGYWISEIKWCILKNDKQVKQNIYELILDNDL